MEENRNDIEILKAMIKDNFEEQRKLIAKLETALWMSRKNNAFCYVHWTFAIINI